VRQVTCDEEVTSSKKMQLTFTFILAEAGRAHPLSEKSFTTEEML